MAALISAAAAGGGGAAGNASLAASPPPPAAAAAPASAPSPSPWDEQTTTLIRALAAATGSSKRLFYDPADPTKTTKVKNVEKWVSAGAAAVGVAVLACAVLGFLMRNNAVFCGMGIAANASSALFGR